MWVCMCVGVWGGGLEGYVFCCDNLYYGFDFCFPSVLLIQHVCLLLSV